MGHWLAVQLEQPGPNGFAVGAWIEVRAGDRTVPYEQAIGGGHAGDQLGWIHFGLGDSGSAEIRVQWPGGETGPWQRVAADTFVIVTRGASEPRYWAAGEGDPRGSG
jgi:enediyne biosynthesis protein E4